MIHIQQATALEQIEHFCCMAIMGYIAVVALYLLASIAG